MRHGSPLNSTAARRGRSREPQARRAGDTDGEPTAHLDRSGEAEFSYPPHPVTLALTVRALDDVHRLGAQTTIFRLGDDPGLARLVDQLARRVEGRVVAPDLDALGAAVVGSYLRSRDPDDPSALWQ